MGLFMNGFKRPRKISSHYIPPFWGDRSDGILTAGTTYYPSEEFEVYSGFCIKQFSSIDWDPETEETLTVDEPCRGLILFIDGDVNIGERATISMAKKGSILPVNPENLIEMYGDSAQIRHIVKKLKTLRGGNGGDGGTAADSLAGIPGTGGIGRVCQGGLGGGPSAGGCIYAGGDGGSVDLPEVIGHTGGPSGSSTNGPGQDGWNGGPGGVGSWSDDDVQLAGRGGISWGASGGAGGAPNDCENGTDGEHTGGFILIIARGSVTITGTLDVTGGNGGNGGIGHSGNGGAGAGAGGGVVAVFSKGAINTAMATKTLLGGIQGTSGPGTVAATAGGSGTYYEERI